MANNGVPSDSNWRELARQIQEEDDPAKMIDLVQEQIAKFDEEKVRNSPPTETSKPSGFLTSKPR